MRLASSIPVRSFYRAAALLPLLGLAIAAVVRRDPAADLPPGWDWVYPASITRGVIAYGLLAGWLWIQIGRRPVAEIQPLLWRAPVIYVVLGWGLMLGLALVRGQVSDLWAEHAGAIVLRTLVHLVVGLGYVALAQVALAALRDDGRLTETA